MKDLKSELQAVSVIMILFSLAVIVLDYFLFNQYVILWSGLQNMLAILSLESAWAFVRHDLFVFFALITGLAGAASASD